VEELRRLFLVFSKRNEVSEYGTDKLRVGEDDGVGSFLRRSSPFPLLHNTIHPISELVV
jgi:hypothetical protein